MEVKRWHCLSALLSLASTGAVLYMLLKAYTHGYETTIQINNYGEAVPEIVAMIFIMALNIAFVVVLCRE